MNTVHLVPTGVANTASVRAAFGRLGCGVAVADSPTAIADAPRLVMPGVGAFDAAMGRLRDADLVAPLQARVQDGRPTLSICLGMQLLGAASEESGAVPGLEVAAAAATRFGADVRVPHMGWTAVTAPADCAILASGAAYFAHSYRWVEVPAGFTAARATHGAAFVAAVERGAVVGCQFHPELSGAFGEGILRRWLAAGGVTW